MPYAFAGMPPDGAYSWKNGASSGQPVPAAAGLSPDPVPEPPIPAWCSPTKQSPS